MALARAQARGDKVQVLKLECAGNLLNKLIKSELDGGRERSK
jgi:hypothetical protein